MRRRSMNAHEYKKHFETALAAVEHLHSTVKKVAEDNAHPWVGSSGTVLLEGPNVHEAKKLLLDIIGSVEQVLRTGELEHMVKSFPRYHEPCGYCGYPIIPDVHKAVMDPAGVLYHMGRGEKATVDIDDRICSAALSSSRRKFLIEIF